MSTMNTGLETGKSLQVFDPSTPGRDLTAYIASVNSIAVLSPEQELELAKQYYYDNNVDAARQLVMAHLRFVVHLAKTYSGYGLPQARPDSGRQCGPDESRQALQPGSGCAPGVICRALDQGRNA